MIKLLLKLFFVFIFLGFVFFLQKNTTYAQTCGGSGQCGTYTETCTLSNGATCQKGAPGCVCTSTCNLTTSTYSCSYNSLISACTPNYPSQVPECSAGGCAQNNCTGPTCTASCGPWSVTCGSASRTCTSTNCSTYTDYGTVSCPTGEYCSTNSCYTYRSITVNVIRDYDHNSTTNGGDTGYSGVNVAAGASSATTDAGGTNVFSSLTQGTYNVSVTVPSGWAVSNGGAASTSVSVTTSNTTVNFYLTKLYTINIGAYVDTDNNLTEATSFPNGAESAYGGLVVKLMQGGSEVRRITTGTNGQNSFSANVLSGSYNLTFDVPAGFEFRRPTSADCSPPSCRGSITDAISFSTTAVDTNPKSRDFIFTELYNISGTVHRNTITGVGYAGGASVTLKQSGSSLATVTTDGSGNYTFSNYMPGSTSYTVALDVPNNFVATKQGDQTCSPTNCQGVVNDPTTIGPDRTAVDFVISTIQSCTVSGNVYVDANENGVKDTGESGYNGASLNLGQGGTSIASTTSGAGGDYSFGSYQDGNSYTVTLTVPASYTLTTTPAAKSASVCPNATVNYGIAEQTYSITGRVFVDSNADGTKQAGESLYGGAVATELKQGSTSIATRNTASASYPAQVAGSYRIILTLPSGYFATEGNCSTADCQGASSFLFSLPPPASIDMGIAPIPTPPPCNATCCFRGTVSVDTDYDGQPNRPYGAGIPANNIELLHGGATDGTDTTGQGGKYAINSNTARTNYRVHLNLLTTGYTAASTNPVPNIACSGPNQTITTDFLIQLPGYKVSGRVFTDRNGNGFQDGGEPGFVRTITIKKTNGEIVGQPASDANPGNYSSEAVPLPAGSYTAQIDVPAGYEVTTPPNPRSFTLGPDTTINFGLTSLPVGNIDGATCSLWNGWTCDASDYNQTLDVHFYADGVAGGGGTYVGATTANGPRPDLGGPCGGTTNHAFGFTAIPDSLKDGQSHSIYAYGIDYPTGTRNPLLGGSPKNITCGTTGTVSSTPTSCTIDPNDADGLCAVTIDYIYNGPPGGVCVSTPGSGESAFSGGPSGVNNSASAPWINGTDPYTFTLRSPLNSCTGPIIDTVVVRGTQTYKISGNVYVDADGNGFKDASESNYTGANLIVRNSVGATVSSPTTSGAGSTNYTTYPPTLLDLGTYSVTLTIPAGYALTTPPNPKSITLGPNGTVNFGIRQSYSALANALVDNDLNNCTAGATTYNQSAVSFSLTDTVTGDTTNSGSQNPATYTFTNILPNAQQISMSVPTGFRVSDIAINPGSGTRVGNSLNFTADSNKTVNFCITDTVAWYQTDQGDVRFPKITNKVPVGKAAGLLGNSVFASSSNTSDFGRGGSAIGDSDKWVINNEYSSNSGAKNALGSFSYDFYRDRAAKNGVTIQTLSSIPAASDCVPNGTCALPVLATGIYEVDGNLAISGVDGPQTNHVVLLINGDTNITGNISTGGSGLFILAAKQNLTIGKTVGTSASNTSSFQLSGFFSAQGNIVIDGDGVAGCLSGPGDLRLNTEGALIANSLYPLATSGGGGTIQNNRSLCSDDATYPSFYVAMKPSFFTQLTDFYKVTNKRWLQVQP